MKPITIKILIYLGILTIYGIVAEVLKTAAVAWLGLIVIGAILFDIGRSMKNKQARKKYIIFTSIIVGQMVFFQLLSIALNVSTENTWLGLLGANAILLSIFAMMLHIAKPMRDTRRALCLLLHLVAYFGIAMVVMVNLSVLLGGFGR